MMTTKDKMVHGHTTETDQRDPTQPPANWLFKQSRANHVALLQVAVRKADVRGQ